MNTWSQDLYPHQYFPGEMTWRHTPAPSYLHELTYLSTIAGKIFHGTNPHSGKYITHIILIDRSYFKIVSKLAHFCNQFPD